jgi:hypothetical protein
LGNISHSTISRGSPFQRDDKREFNTGYYMLIRLSSKSIIALPKFKTGKITGILADLEIVRVYDMGVGPQ